ncbi:unnamed protein product [Cochlearia groenlandica]
MASFNLRASASLFNESLFSSLKSRIVFTSKRLRRVAKRFRFNVQSVKEQRKTKHQLSCPASSRESLLYMLKQYGVSIAKLEGNKTSRVLDDRDQQAGVSSCAVDESKMNTIEELPDLRRLEICHETVTTAESVSGQNRHYTQHLKASALFTSLLHVLVFCIICILGTVHTIISRKTSQSHHHNSEKTRWRTALSDCNEADEHDSSLEDKVVSTDQEAMEEVDEEYSKVEIEYKRFLLECGLG